MVENGNDTNIEENTARQATPEAGTNGIDQDKAQDEPPGSNVERVFRRCTLCNYSLLTTSIILLMVVAGAGRSVAVKAYFQTGFESPLLVTLLYLLGSLLCIFPYYAALWANKFYTKTFHGVNGPVIQNEPTIENMLRE